MHTGSSNFKTADGNLYLKNMLHVPKITKNLLSIARLTRDNNAIVEFNSKFVFVKDKDSKRVLLRGVLKDGLYKVLIPHVFSNFSGVANNSSMALFNSVSNQFNCFSSSVSVNKLWHFRLGHPAPLIMNKVAAQCNNSFFINSSTDSFCTACQLGKNHRLYAPSSSTKSHAPLELVLSDVWGPAPIQSPEGYKYYILFEDNYTRFCWIYPMKLKSEAT